MSDTNLETATRRLHEAYVVIESLREQRQELGECLLKAKRQVRHLRDQLAKAGELAEAITTAQRDGWGSRQYIAVMTAYDAFRAARETKK